MAATEYKTWGHVGALDNGKFPLVDFHKGNTLVSLKSVDTAGKSWFGEMARHIDDLATRGATVDRRPATMVLDLRVPPGGTEAARPLIQYGRGQNVNVLIKEIMLL